MKTITLTNPQHLRERMLAVFEAVKAALIGGPVEITVQRPSKSREQEKRYHAMIGDIARTVEIDGRYYDTDVWKAKLLDEFSREMARQGTPLAHPGRIVMSLDGQRYITVRPSSSKFRKDEAAQFVEFLHSTGIDLGAIFSDPSLRYYEEIAERVA